MTSKLVLAALLLFLSWNLHVLAEDRLDVAEGDTTDAVYYNGMTYDQALAGFQSDLNPSIQANALEALIQFAIRDHQADDVARLLIKEGRTIPLELLLSFNPQSGEPILPQLLENLRKIPKTDAEDLWISIDELRHWRRVLMGIHRLALLQRDVFEQAMRDPKTDTHAKILAQLAVQDADFQAAAVQELLDLLSPKPKSDAAVQIDDVFSASSKESAPSKP